VVTRDCAPDTVYAGVPARAIRALPVESQGTQPSAASAPDTAEPDRRSASFA
jgi:hypothetical protein